MVAPSLRKVSRLLPLRRGSLPFISGWRTRSGARMKQMRPFHERLAEGGELKSFLKILRDEGKLLAEGKGLIPNEARLSSQWKR